jgi:hypothetical protein
MSVFERFANKRRRDDEGAPTRANCLRCRREYTRDPDAATAGTYCWWCTLRVEHLDVLPARE